MYMYSPKTFSTWALLQSSRYAYSKMIFQSSVMVSSTAMQQNNNQHHILLNYNSLQIIDFLSNTHMDYITSNFQYELDLNQIKKFLYQYISFHIINISKIKSYKMLAI